jgi:phosphoglycerate kinase
MNKLTVRDLDVRGKRVFLRVDFNVPLTESGAIRDDARIRATLPTIRYLLEHGAAVICASHLGKPKAAPDPGLSLKPVAERLSELLSRPVRFAPDCVGPEAKAAAGRAGPGSVVLLENLRFHKGETENDAQFAGELAGLADLYVDDAFGAAHRAHASTAGMAAFFKQPAAGLLMAEEIDYLSRVTESPTRPYTAVIGGSKVSDKAGVIGNLLPKVDRLLLGGGVAFNFLVNRGFSVGRSLYDPDLADEVRKLGDSPKLALPVDVVVAPSPDDEAQARVAAVDAIPADEMGLDIGPRTTVEFRDLLARARTIVWAGPMGVFEHDAFARGTKGIAEAMADATAGGAVTVVGGGDTGAALGRFGLSGKVSHVSTGGGACLEFLEGRTLPGLASLKDK